ncbi:30S ribosomal protein S9 [Candidatus Falkowbacteria bacterium CG11_big_fil_rev_8_21_14_0_20_39_10]|uniref:Small ribosomal subunit protein uS9 n=1 Tax=Candidatus Falkowbacteria bacterium CG11_big_fil_rev_8_21_14_0_20_39_10 TaxID=1974570 RepID=A0A2M6K8N9_9BACT|nr:MAG: 30S ribosomal protein S9 [Candidatus Falkowbacteria bacterium CG11_big_fil_rev_8_21_14_0_20_39_10]
MTEQKDKIKEDKEINFKGKYILAIGRRKRSAALVRLYKNGKGNILVNEMKPSKYFSQDKVIIVNQPLKLTGHLRDMDFSILVKGGGKKGQAEAIRHGLTRALISIDKELKPSLKAKGWLTRDSRKVERKKPGLKKARRAPQWSKR